MKIPRLVLAGTHSGVGKTTLATGLMAALKKRGRPIQGYKVGPDYIDPSYHTAATGRASRNLDRWLLGEHLTSVFTQSSVEHWAVVEGVMGLFDGMNGREDFGSTADVAKLLKAPIILIVDVSSMSRSVAALVHGYNTFDPEVKLQGVILNRVKSSVQEEMVKDALRELQIPVLGGLPQEMALQLPERHLGLVPVGEDGLLEDFIDTLAKLVTKHVDLEQVERIMAGAPDLNKIIFENTNSVLHKKDGSGTYDILIQTKPIAEKDKFRLGLALDDAFLFYYQDALELAKRLNFIIVPFSPLHDSELPPDLDGIFIGGGFPELHLDRLSENLSFLDSLRSYAASGKPIYAEGGGYLYLGRSLTDFTGREVPLAGLIPMKAEMTQSLQGIGYRRGVFRNDTFLGPRGTTVQGHEFRYSRVSCDQEFLPVYDLYKGDHYDRMEGYARDNIAASYLHLHFSGQAELLEQWFTSRTERTGT